MLERRWLKYCLFFVPATFSRETSVLLVPIYLLTFRRDAGSRRLFDRLLGFQVLAYVAVKATLGYVYRSNPGVFVEWHIVHNLILPPWTPSEFLGYCTLFFVAIYDWQAKPALVRGNLWMFPLMLVIMFFIGLVDELHVYYELYPGLIVAATYMVCRIMKVPCRTIAPTDKVSVLPATPAPVEAGVAAVA